MIDVQEKRMPAEVEVPTGTKKITFQIHFIPKMQNSQKNKDDMAWDLNLIKDIVIAVLVCAVISTNKWIGSGMVNKAATILTVGAIIIYGLFAFDVWLRCRKQV